jgi:hypothetical protein
MNWQAAILALMLTMVSAEVALASAPTQSLRPLARPSGGQGTQTEPVAMVASIAPIFRSLRPVQRPANSNQIQTASKSKQIRKPRQTRKGMVCGVKGIKGEKIKPIRGKLRGCGVNKPVRVTSVDGVALSQSAIMDCGTAKALNTWVRKGVKPAIGRLGGGVKSLQVFAHYSCRSRNNQKGAKISEHGKGHAIDIGAFNLANGQSISVLKGWRNPAHGKVLKAMHRSACGPFGTVLGPNSDSFHRDHFHVDTARYRSGAYCR